MLDGFPLPDFDFEDDHEQIYPALETPKKKIDPEDIDDLCSQSRIILDSKTPEKSTSNSLVFYGKCYDSDERFAVKITPHKHRVRDEYQKRLLVPDSPFLVKTIDLKENNAGAMLQMELCEHGDLVNTDNQEYEIWCIIHDIGRALLHLHENHWMHLDVSPGNILITKDQYKLTDFGTLTLEGHFEEGNEGAGPYVSPEALAYPSGEYPVTYATDIFSFGLVLFEAATGKPIPRGGSTNYSRIRNGEILLGSDRYPCSHSDELISLINMMISHNPNNRPTAAQIVDLAEANLLEYEVVM